MIVIDWNVIGVSLFLLTVLFFYYVRKHILLVAKFLVLILFLLSVSIYTVIQLCWYWVWDKRKHAELSRQIDNL